MLFQADVAEAANARLPTVAWLTRGMARSVVDDDRSRCNDNAGFPLLLLLYEFVNAPKSLKEKTNRGSGDSHVIICS